MIRVAAIDEHPIFLAGLVNSLAAEPGIEVVAQGNSAADAVRASQQHLPDVLVLGISLPDAGLATLTSIRSTCADVKTLMLTVSAEQQQIASALQAGAWGYLLRGVSGSEVVRAVRSIYNGQTYISPNLVANLLSAAARAATLRKQEPQSVCELSLRQKQVLSLLRQGLSNKQIGVRLGLSDKTVKYHVTHLLQKLQVRNRLQAALLARPQMPAAFSRGAE
jgi:two-component system nitrate/nitrite response regulator NarL